MTPKQFKQFKEGIFKHMQHMRIESDGNHSFELELTDAIGQVTFSVEIRELEFGDGFNEQRVIDTELTLLWVDIRIINDDGEGYIPAKLLVELENEFKISNIW